MSQSYEATSHDPGTALPAQSHGVNRERRTALALTQYLSDTLIRTGEETA